MTTLFCVVQDAKMRALAAEKESQERRAAELQQILGRGAWNSLPLATVPSL
jgi:hypothetical protein